jgi:hypothetical protein
LLALEAVALQLLVEVIFAALQFWAQMAVYLLLNLLVVQAAQH